ncbi:Similar to Copper amine oxidase 1; acc. no. Q12556 [Pyronema omphalodes CBS 100304]|uniref:Amine oxidase n=1 Tax=Pyronema omphalodes (strain CBS 100304) TaxID=1076935 RepID=U4LR75_PYROM|nr:Similar to Copper amine oxidase 1; acc. no. Q12556 [Pyronema omphalodes CBS 100304]
MTVDIHPLTPLLPAEIVLSHEILKSSFAFNRTAEQSFHFKCITLHEPPKADLLAWQTGGPKPLRCAYAAYYIRNTPSFFESVIDLETSSLLSTIPIKAHFHGPADGPEILLVEKVALEDPKVQAELAKLELPAGSKVVSDPWIYGSDGIDDERRQFQCFLYLQHDEKLPDANHYAFPLSVSPIVDVATMKVVRIQHLPCGVDETPTLPKPYQVPPPNEYTPESQELRTDLKPLHIVQPEGASFTVAEDIPDSGGAIIEWQKWRFRTGFNHREGMVLYELSYAGRDIVYRVALSDMCIPYADPRSPYHKKAAFDLGDAGAGVMANNLQLGCDCLGSIHYLSSTISHESGRALIMPNVICIHEQDSGIGFKHMNYRTNRAVVTRARELVVQSIITVSNYEYILAFVFGQSGDWHYEVRATGILSTSPIDQGLEVPWGTVVHPGVLAASHQHIFSLRVDPAIDGQGNKVVIEEAHAMPLGPQNPHGTGYITKETELTHSGGYDTNTAANRTFKIQSQTRKNAINGANTGYRITVPPFQKLLAHPTSYHHARAEFGDNAIYLTKYRDGEFYAAGKWTNQSRGGEGVRAASDRKEELDGQPVVWVQFGLNHVPRTEDFPVMPCEIIRVGFKPHNFWERNPGIDVPPSSQERNKSILLGGKVGTGVNGDATSHRQGQVEAKVGMNGHIEKVNGCCTK